VSRRARRPALVAGAVVLGIALGVGIDIARTGGLEAWQAARGPGPQSDPGPPYEARGRLIEVDGRDVYVDCRGAGSPTVILEAGFGSGAGGWGHVLDGIAATTRVCAWDRPGLGRSTGRGLHTGAEAVADLRAALAGAGERGPFVVVAHSLGGVYAQLFAAEPAADGSRVEAFVMLDTYEPLLGMDTDPSLPADVRAEIRESIDGTGEMIQGGEDLDWAATMVELEALGPVTLPSVLLMIDPRLRYGDPAQPGPAALIDAWNRAMARRYPEGRLVLVPNSGHLVQFDQPNLVIARIRELVLQLRAG
jgi:pimeloyl-ACP methyl ester carboxylesterase